MCLKHRLNPIAQCSNVLANTPHTPKASIHTWQQQGNSRESQNAPLAPHGALAPFLQARAERGCVPQTPTKSHCPVLNCVGQYSTHTQSLYSHLAATRQLTGESECTSRTTRSASPVPAGPHVKWSHALNTECTRGSISSIISNVLIGKCPIPGIGCELISHS